jgi:hypothetical protein
MLDRRRYIDSPSQISALFNSHYSTSTEHYILILDYRYAKTKHNCRRKMTQSDGNIGVLALRAL